MPDFPATDPLFLSTLSLRRATPRPSPSCHPVWDFYPRSPCGERPVSVAACSGVSYFYPRSPCGERRLLRCPVCGCTLISIHALLAESDTSQPHCAGSFAISIHALLAESDPIISSATSCRWLFLSTLSLRRATCAPVAAIGHRLRISIHALLAESDCADNVL